MYSEHILYVHFLWNGHTYEQIELPKITIICHFLVTAATAATAEAYSYNK